MEKVTNPSKIIKEALGQGKPNQQKVPEGVKISTIQPHGPKPHGHVCGGTGGKRDVREEHLRQSTIQTFSGEIMISNAQGYKIGNTIYAEVFHSGLTSSAEIMYGIGTAPFTADISPWQAFEKEKKVTMPHNILMWTRSADKEQPVYMTFHVLDEGIIGPPVFTRVDHLSSQGPGGDIELAVFRRTDEGTKLSGPRFFKPQIGTRSIETLQNDKTPIITAEKQFSIFSAYVEFESRDDTATNYVYSIGTQPKLSDLISSKSLLPNQRKSGWHSFAELAAEAAMNGKEFKITDTFYINVWAYYANDPNAPGGYSYGNKTSSSAMQFTWEDLGTIKGVQKKITYVFPDEGLDKEGNIIPGWSTEEKEQLNDFCIKMNDIIEEVYGPPAHSMDLKFVKNEWYSDSAIYFTGVNEIHMKNVTEVKEGRLIQYWQLLTHEILHAFHGHVNFENNENWKHDVQLMGFEEGFAHAVSYICMNKYGDKYPDDPKAQDSNGVVSFWQPSTLADYDYKNHDHLATEDFWTADQGNPMNIVIERYEMAASVFFKIYIENKSFFKTFNEKYYAYLNGNQDETPTKSLLVNIIATTIGQVEGMPVIEWINNQRILDCKYTIGDKVRLQSNPLIYYNEFAYQNHAYHYQTFPDGTDWYYKKEQRFHHYNGRRGVFEVRRVSDNNDLVKSGEIFPMPSTNPPFSLAIAHGSINLSTAANNSSIKQEEGNHFKMIPINEQLALYRITIGYDQGRLQNQAAFYRLVGTALIDAKQVICGAFHKIRADEVMLKHMDFPDSPVVATVLDNTWIAEVPWDFSAPSAAAHLKKFPMGKVEIVYKNSADGKYYRTYRNLGFGELNRGVNFIFIYRDKVKQLVGSGPFS